MPDINFPDSPSGGDIYTYNNITFTYDGEKWTAKAPVTSTSSYGDANVAAYASGQGFIDLTDISVTSNSPSGNGSLSYNNTNGVLTFTPADASGSGGGNYGDSNVASFLSTNSYSNVAYGNTEVQTYLNAQGYSNVDLDAQEISLAGNVISLTGQTGNVDLTSLLGLGYFDPTSEVTFTKDVHFNRGVEEKFGSLSGQSGTVAHNLNDGHVFYHTTPAGNFTANFTNFNLDAGYTTAITIIVNQGATAYIPNAVQIGGSAQTLNWQGGSAPSGTSNGIDAISFTILNDSGSYIVLGQLVDFT
tara:strand:- start:122 stop:1027 length:906 start_codon:yes stop_codon:yes gene_type:complete